MHHPVLQFTIITHDGVTGKSVHFSEQQLMDCSWDYAGNSACDGGEYDGALDYLIDAGGAVPDQQYQYLGQDGWCTDKNHSDTHVSNLTTFKVPSSWMLPSACCLMAMYRQESLQAD